MAIGHCMLAAACLLAAAPDSKMDAKLNDVLENWQRRSKERTRLDVLVTRKDSESSLGDQNFTGRVVLLPKSQAYVEFSERDPAGESRLSERWVWTKEAVHHFRADQKQHFIWPIAEQDRGRLPAMLALPFLWHVDANQLHSRYTIRLHSEEADSWILAFEPVKNTSACSFSKAYLKLSKEMLLPQRYLVVSPDGNSRKDFVLTEVQPEKPGMEKVLEIRDDKDWKVVKSGGSSPNDGLEGKLTGWFVRSLKPDLLP